jgi:hypothetical protein
MFLLEMTKKAFNSHNEILNHFSLPGTRVSIGFSVLDS